MAEVKEKLLHLIEIGRQKEAEVLLPHVDDTEPSTPGQWTVKDTVAHLMSWRMEYVGEFDSALTGAPPPVVDDDDDVTNAGFYKETHHLPAKTILEAATKSWDALAGAVGKCTEKQLQGPRPGHPEIKLWMMVPQVAVDHLADHMEYWYADHGDPTSEEAAAMWRYDSNVRAFDDDRRRGVEEYMLGRFYATHGRRDEAASRLDRALQLRPDLRGFAQEDPELKGLLP